MELFRWLLRKRQSRGRGIHSPFAFELITQVLYSPHSYYAFSDIPETVGHDCEKETNQMSFRLVNHFKPENILEINPGKGIGSLYILSASSKINYTSVETNKNNLSSFKETISSYRKSREHYYIEDNVNFVSCLEEIKSKKFDAIFVNLDHKDNFLPSLERLFELSCENCFWVIKPINKKLSKQFWRHIVKDARINITFDFKNKAGIAFLRSAYYKQHFFV